jgi:hypothetical protein
MGPLGASDAQETEIYRAPEIFGRILNLRIVAFQTGLIEFLSKAGPFIQVCRMQRVLNDRRNGSDSQ